MPLRRRLPRLALTTLLIAPWLGAADIPAALAPKPAAPAAGTAVVAAKPRLAPTRSLQLELQGLIRLLEEVHVNRDRVTPASYAEVIPNTFKALDGQHLFLLASDIEALQARYQPDADALYLTLSTLGRLDLAFAIFERYEQRVRERVEWIQARLGRDFDFTTEGTYVLDRTKLPWPADQAASDALWEDRLKFELLQEILNDKPNPEVKLAPLPDGSAPETPAPAPEIAPVPDTATQSPLDKARAKVAKRYERILKNLDDYGSDDVAEVFLTAIAGLYDPHSTYFSPDTYEEFGISIRLQLFGIGALLSLEEDVCVIKEIIPGGPADISRLIKPNDKIFAVAQETGDYVEVVGMKLRRIVQMIRGEKGTKVRLLIQPADAADAAVRKEIVLVRDLINIDSARAHGAVFQVPGPDGAPRPYGVITLPTFYGRDRRDAKDQNSATDDVARLVRDLQAQGIEGLVLDLRRNGGGLLGEAVSLTGLFIPSGPVVQIKNHAGEVKVDEDEDPAVAYTGPLVVLTSRFSASASEIVAGALQNYGRAVVIGDTSTHGKGTVQTVIEMGNVVPQLARRGQAAGATKVTVQKFYLPNGASTQLRGVVPDIVIPSIDEFLPIGEQDLPRALPWDEISTSFYEATPFAPDTLAGLRARSADRVASLPEFALLRRSIDRFRERQAEKSVSLNLETRRAGKAGDKAFGEEIKAARKELEASSAYPFTEYFVAPPPAPRIKAEDDASEDGEEDEAGANERYARLDVYLRESLRVLDDLRSARGAPATAVAAAAR